MWRRPWRTPLSTSVEVEEERDRIARWNGFACVHPGMRAMIRRFSVSLLAGLILVIGLLADQPEKNGIGKKVIEWGWDEPDTKFMRENIDKMEQFPFDGLVFHPLS